jgi:hypothetical protein
MQDRGGLYQLVKDVAISYHNLPAFHYMITGSLGRGPEEKLKSGLRLLVDLLELACTFKVINYLLFTLRVESTYSNRIGHYFLLRHLRFGFCPTLHRSARLGRRPRSCQLLQPKHMQRWPNRSGWTPLSRNFPKLPLHRQRLRR